MADSDGDYVADDMSDDDLLDHQVTSQPAGTTTAAAAAAARTSQKRKKAGHSRAKWEEVNRSWDVVEEGADGSIKASVAEEMEYEKRMRLLRDTTPLQRGIIRHLVLVLDMSFAMAEKDLMPTRYILTMDYAIEFVREFFEQNPISQLGIVGMRDGKAIRIADVSGNPDEQIQKLRDLRMGDPSGNPSLQNALEMCRGTLFHAPPHGTREVLIIYGALITIDPGDIHDTIDALIRDRIRVSIVGLAAEVRICTEICARTNAGDDSTYSVALNDVHFRDRLLAATTPPVTRAKEHAKPSLLMMGFPSRTVDKPEDAVTDCACHHRPTREGYMCTRCGTRVCRLPVECPSCGLTLILSTHLARSYHHLFPLKTWKEVPWSEVSTQACFSCLAPFPNTRESGKVMREGVSESGRYGCTVCGNHFCIDCDVFAHEVIHNCPGCQCLAEVSEKKGRGKRAQREQAVVVAANGNTLANGAMVID